MSETALLDSCRDQIAARLSEDLAQILAKVVSELTELVGNMPSQDMYVLYMDSLEMARDKSPLITAAFKKAFFNHFNTEKQHLRHESGGAAHVSLDLASLSLLLLLLFARRYVGRCSVAAMCCSDWASAWAYC